MAAVVSRGSKHGKSKLSESDVTKIWEMLVDGMTYPEIGKRFGVDGSTIYSISRGKTWRHVPAPAGYKNPRQKLTARDIPEIWEMLTDGIMYREIGKRFGVSLPTICSISRGKTWRHVPAPAGYKNPRRKLTARDIPEILAMRADGVTYTAIGQVYNVTQATIGRIDNGVAWICVTGGVPISRPPTNADSTISEKIPI